MPRWKGCISGLKDREKQSMGEKKKKKADEATALLGGISSIFYLQPNLLPGIKKTWGCLNCAIHQWLLEALILILGGTFSHQVILWRNFLFTCFVSCALKTHDRISKTMDAAPSSCSSGWARSPELVSAAHPGKQKRLENLLHWDAPAKEEGSGIQGEPKLTQPDFTGQVKNTAGKITQLVKYQSTCPASVRIRIPYQDLGLKCHQAWWPVRIILALGKRKQTDPV